jgi:hypothetical protein
MVYYRALAKHDSNGNIAAWIVIFELSHAFDNQISEKVR